MTSPVVTGVKYWNLSIAKLPQLKAFRTKGWQTGYGIFGVKLHTVGYGLVSTCRHRWVEVQASPHIWILS